MQQTAPRAGGMKEFHILRIHCSDAEWIKRLSMAGAKITFESPAIFPVSKEGPFKSEDELTLGRKYTVDVRDVIAGNEMRGLVLTDVHLATSAAKYDPQVHYTQLVLVFEPAGCDNAPFSVSAHLQNTIKDFLNARFRGFEIKMNTWKDGSQRMECITVRQRHPKGPEHADMSVYWNKDAGLWFAIPNIGKWAA